MLKVPYSPSDKVSRKRPFEFLSNVPWTWSVAGALLTLAAAAIGFGSQTAANMISSGSPFVVFMVLVGLGQMLVITTGAGNIDLSVPAVMALAGAVSMHVMAATDSATLGIVAALGTGVLTGGLNYLLIRLLRIPPIIATLSSSFIWQSVAISQGQGNAGPPAGLENWVLSRYFGLSSLILIGVAISALLAVALFKMVIGRQLSALGQNARAAQLAGVRVEPLRCGAYIVCSVLAAVAAVLLATFSGGATLDMGTEYMLLSVAVVVIGGTRISGGGPVPGGVWGASCFLYLLNALLSASSAGAGARAIIYGGLIILVTFVAGTKRKA